MTLANGADAAVILGVVVAVLVYVFNRKRAAGADVLAAVNTLRDEVLTSVNNLRDEMQTSINTLRDEMQTSINTLRDEMQTSVNTLRDEVRRDVGRIEAEVRELRTDIAGIDRRLVAVETTLSTMRMTGALTTANPAPEPDQP